MSCQSPRPIRWSRYLIIVEASMHCRSNLLESREGDVSGMDRSTLARLSVDGFSAVRGNKLETLAKWCSDWCTESGDARYCILSDCLQQLWDWWEDHSESRGGVPSDLVAEIENSVKQQLPAIISAGQASYAAYLAAALRQQIFSLLLPVEDWGPWLGQKDKV